MASKQSVQKRWLSTDDDMGGLGGARSASDASAQRQLPSNGARAFSIHSVGDGKYEKIHPTCARMLVGKHTAHGAAMSACARGQACNTWCGASKKWGAVDSPTRRCGSGGVSTGRQLMCPLIIPEHAKMH